MKYLAGLLLLTLLAPVVPAADDPDATTTHTTCAKPALRGPAFYCRMDLIEVRTGALLDYVVYVPAPLPADAFSTGMPPECGTALLGHCLGGALCVVAPLADATLANLCASQHASASNGRWRFYQYKWSGAQLDFTPPCDNITEQQVPELSAYRLSFFSFQTWNDVPSSGDSTGCQVGIYSDSFYSGSAWSCARNYICDWTGQWNDNIASSLTIR